MSMFPGANAQIYRNEAGEVLGWDYPSSDPPGDDWDDDWDDQFEGNWELEPLTLPECVESGQHGRNATGEGGEWSDELNEHVGGTMICDRCEYPVDQVNV